MSMPSLDQMTDSQLSALVAEKVAGWKPMRFVQDGHYYLVPGNILDQIAWPGSSWRHGQGDARERRDFARTFSSFKGFDIPAYATDANAVLPLLEKHRWRREIDGDVWIFDENGKGALKRWWVSPKGLTFARAACLALIRANGGEG